MIFNYCQNDIFGVTWGHILKIWRTDLTDSTTLTSTAIGKCFRCTYSIKYRKLKQGGAVLQQYVHVVASFVWKMCTLYVTFKSEWKSRISGIYFIQNLLRNVRWDARICSPSKPLKEITKDIHCQTHVKGCGLRTILIYAMFKTFELQTLNWIHQKIVMLCYANVFHRGAFTIQWLLLGENH